MAVLAKNQPLTLTFSQVTPAPLAGVTPLVSEVWATELTLEAGRRYLVTAPSGKGKSTFVGLLYGLRRDYSGQIRLGDREARSLSAADWAGLRRDGYSIVFQDLRLFPDRTGWENLRLRTNLFGLTDKSRLQAMAERLGVDGLLSKKCGLLSYGERQRVALLRALAAPARWLLLDEPFSHLDAANTQLAASLIDQYCQTHGAGFILTSLGYEVPLGYDVKLKL